MNPLCFCYSFVFAYTFFAYFMFGAARLGHCTPAWVLAGLAIILSGISAMGWSYRRLFVRPRNQLFVALFFLFLAILYAHVFWIPPFVRDDMIYHLRVAKQMSMTGKLSFDPFNINSNFPMLFEMPLAAIAMLHGALSPFVVNYVFGLLFVLVFYVGLSRHAGLSQGTAIMAALALATTPVFIDLLHTAYVEIFFSLLLLLAALAYFEHLEGSGDGRDWFRCCACLGLAAAVKYPGCIFAMIFFGYEFFRKNEARKFYLGLLLCVCLAFPWYLKNWIWTGNPVFPFLNPLFGSPYISPIRWEAFRHMLVDYNMGRKASDYLLLPFRLAFGIDRPHPPSLGFDGKLSLLCVIACLGLGWKESKQRFASILGLVYFSIWAWESQQVRLLLPLLPLLCLFGLRRLRLLGIAPKWVILGMSLIVLQNAFNVQAAMRKEGIINLLAGKSSREEFLTRQMPISYGLARELNRRLDPTHDKLMTVGNFGRDYYFDIPVLTHTFYDEEVFRKSFAKGRLEPDSVNAFLRQNRITHILFNWDYVRRMHANDTGFDMAALKKYFETRFRPVYSNGKVFVLQRI